MQPENRPKLDRIPPDLAAVADYEPRAKDFVPHAIYEYVAGGVADDLTLRENRRAFDRIELAGRVLTDCGNGTTALTLLGQPFRHPIFLAPVAYQQIVHPAGEIATAQAADALEAGFVASTLSLVSLGGVAVRDIRLGRAALHPGPPFVRVRRLDINLAVITGTTHSPPDRRGAGGWPYHSYDTFAT